MLDTTQHPLLSDASLSCSFATRLADLDGTDPQISTALLRKLFGEGASFADLARQASCDPLTGLLNRRAFEAELAERSQIRRGGTMLLLDLDHFKRLNDRQGHAAGDTALVCFANALQQAFRPGDLVARLGGDEFAVWMDGADELTAAERADALCRTVRPPSPQPCRPARRAFRCRSASPGTSRARQPRCCWSAPMRPCMSRSAADAAAGASGTPAPRAARCSRA